MRSLLSVPVIVCSFLSVCQFGKIQGVKRLVLTAFLVAVLSGIARLSPVVATDDKVFTTTRLNDWGSVAIQKGKEFGFDVIGLIIPIFEKAGEIATPDFRPSARYKSHVQSWQTPQEMIDFKKLIHWDQNENPVKISAFYGGTFRTDAEHSQHPEWTECQISTKREVSAPVIDAPIAFEGSEFLNATFGIRGKEPNESGVIDFNYMPTVIKDMNPNEDCKKHEIGEELEKLGTNITDFAEFGAGAGTFGMYKGVEQSTLMKIITKIINGQQVTVEEPEEEPTHHSVILTRDAKEDHFNILCNEYWCPKAEIGKGSEGADVTGGWTNAFIPLELAKAVWHASEQAFDIQLVNIPVGRLDVAYDGFKQSQVSLQMTSCLVSPDTSNTSYDNVQKTYAYGDAQNNLQFFSECEPVQACGTEPPKMSGGACKQCSPDMNGWAEGDSVPGGKLPENLLKMVETVGDKMGVPPASILAAMYHEGAFVATQLDTSLYQSGPFVGGDQWTKENVDKWSTCGQTMPNCPAEPNAFKNCNVDGGNSEQCGKAIVGTGQIPKWFWGHGNESDPWAAVLAIDPTRTRDTINPCNLLDSIAATAYELKSFSMVSRTPPACFCKDGSSNYASCAKFAMTSTSGASCQPSTWSEDKIVQSHTGLWVGNLPFCPDGSMPPTADFGQNSTQPAYGKMVLGQYKHFSCQD